MVLCYRKQATNAPALYQSPGHQEKTTLHDSVAEPALGANALPPPGLSGLCPPSPYQARLGTGPGGPSAPATAWEWDRFLAAFLLSKRESWESGCMEHQEEGKRPLAQLLIVSFTSTRPGPQPRPALLQVHGAIVGRPTASQGWPGPRQTSSCSRSAAAGAPRGARKSCGIVVLWVRLRAPPASPIYL